MGPILRSLFGGRGKEGMGEEYEEEGCFYLYHDTAAAHFSIPPLLLFSRQPIQSLSQWRQKEKEEVSAWRRGWLVAFVEKGGIDKAWTRRRRKEIGFSCKRVNKKRKGKTVSISPFLWPVTGAID